MGAELMMICGGKGREEEITFVVVVALMNLKVGMTASATTAG